VSIFLAYLYLAYRV